MSMGDLIQSLLGDLQVIPSHITWHHTAQMADMEEEVTFQGAIDEARSAIVSTRFFDWRSKGTIKLPKEPSRKLKEEFAKLPAKERVWVVDLLLQTYLRRLFLVANLASCLLFVVYVKVVWPQLAMLAIWAVLAAIVFLAFIREYMLMMHGFAPTVAYANLTANLAEFAKVKAENQKLVSEAAKTLTSLEATERRINSLREKLYGELEDLGKVYHEQLAKFNLTSYLGETQIGTVKSLLKTLSTSGVDAETLRCFGSDLA
ncbi:unnamed protein product [Symbiodinium natans]|uniref:Uncharacterized protein n=1 Tax=Symbiodinium natans TaxID=878477 RepID=A0A812T054_9DINO|nr:unnamed protein product [Symbiodinium natans]